MLDKLPLFPLNTVLFPGMPLTLHIFETRYKIMMNKILQGDSLFGVVLIRHGSEALGPLAEIHSIGTIARIVSVERLDRGRMNIVAVGESRFIINEIHKDQPYLTADTDYFPLEYRRPLDVYRRLRNLRNHVQYYLRTLNSIDDIEIDLTQIEMPDDPITLLFLAASLLQIPAPEKQPILAAATALDVCMMVERLFRRENAVLRELRNFSADYVQNISSLN